MGAGNDVQSNNQELLAMAPPSQDPSQRSSSFSKPLQQEIPLNLNQQTPPIEKVSPARPNYTPFGNQQYYIGDEYDHAANLAAVRAEWEIDTESRPYLKYLKNISEGWPEIAWLADFMEVGTSPTKWKYLTKAHTEERAKRTRVTIVELTPGEESTRKDIQKSEQLAEVLNDPAFADPEYARIIIVEDLSRDVIEALGTKYDINPSFFRGQISDFLWFNTRDPWVELSDLDHVGSERNYFNVRYMRPRYFASEASIKDAKDALGSFNVLRHVEEDLSWRVRELKKPVGPTVGVVRSKTSLWIRKNKAGEKGVIGILVVDPTLSQGYPLWQGPHNIRPCPSMHDTVPDPPPRTSLFEDAIHYTRNMPEDELLAIQSQPYSLGLTILNLVAAEWTTVVAYITTGLTKIEWELEHSDYRDEKNGLEAVLDRLHPLRRLLPVYRTMLKDVLNSILHPTNFPRPRNPNSLPSTFEKASHLEKLAADFTSILDRIDRLQVRTQNIISLATTTISIEENQRAMKMNKNLVRVTYLAVVFVPMAFVSSFFSMTPDLGQLTETIWIYFAVSLPLTALCLSVADRRRIVMGFLWINRNSRALFKRKPKRA